MVLGSDCLVFCGYGFGVSALRCPHATPTVLLGFLLPRTWGISSRLLQQRAAAAPYLDEGYPLTAAPPDLERGAAPLRPPAQAQPPLLGGGAALLAAAPDLRGVVVRLAATPDLGRGVAPLGRSCAVAAWRSRSPPGPWTRGSSSQPRFCASRYSPISVLLWVLMHLPGILPTFIMPAACLLIFQDLPQKISYPLCIAFLNAFR